MIELSRRSTPKDWPTSLPPPQSADLPRATLKWLRDEMPHEQWRQLWLTHEPLVGQGAGRVGGAGLSSMAQTAASTRAWLAAAVLGRARPKMVEV